MVNLQDFQSTLNLIEDAIFIYSLDENGVPGTYVYVNDWACEKYGYSRDEFLLMSPMQINERDASEKKFLPALKELKDKKIISFESIHITKDGKRMDVEGHIKMTDIDGRSLAMSIVRNISEHKKIEQKMRDEAEKFSAVFHASTNLVAITRRADGKILEVNEGYSQMLGYSRDESIGKTTSELNIWSNPADRDFFVRELIRTGKVVDLEVTLRRKDGVILTVLDSARVFEYQKEECILSTAIDITKRKQMENDLKKSKDALQENIYELEKINKATVNRELKMVELKNRIKELEEKITPQL